MNEEVNEYFEKFKNIPDKEVIAFFKKYPEHLKIDKSLPQIKLPQNKLNMLLEWFNNDLRFQNDIPKAFNEGYLFVENDFILNDITSNDIKELAKSHNNTYRIMENGILKIYEDFKNIIIYFKFNTNNKLELAFYSNKYILFGQQMFEDFSKEYPYCKTIKNISLKEIVTMKNEKDEVLVVHKLIYNYIAIFTTIMWYLATTKQLVKYKYDINRYTGEKMLEKNKNIVQVKSKKVISTPIYDLNKIRIIKLDKLVQRRKGWTYSHAFEVHGHYRHYKSGKVIFVESFIKDKNKKLKSQEIIINPK